MNRKALTYLCAFIIGASLACSETKPPDFSYVVAPEAKVPRLEWPPGLGSDQAAPEKEVGKKNFYIVFDGSGSMRGWKIETAKKALEKFIQMIPGNANVALLAFDAHGASERAAFGTPREKIIREVFAVAALGGTPLGQSVEIAYNKICAQARRQLGYGEYYIVVVTDGISTDGEKLPLIIDRILRESPVVIHTIGFDIGMGHTLNQPGKTSYRTAQNFRELSEGLGEVLAESEKFTATGL
jgi:Ca-activated chloride channel family protein